MPTKPNSPQPLIPSKIPHLTPVLEGPSNVVPVPESAAFLSHQQYLTEKRKLKFIPVEARSLEQRGRLAYVKVQCEKLERQVMLERMDALTVSLRQEMVGVQARLRKPGKMSVRIRNQRQAEREIIKTKQAEINNLDKARAQLNGVDNVAHLHPMTRNQFLKMAGLTALALAVWNDEVAAQDWVSFTDTCTGSFALATSGDWGAGWAGIASSASWSVSNDGHWGEPEGGRDREEVLAGGIRSEPMAEGGGFPLGQILKKADSMRLDLLRTNLTEAMAAYRAAAAEKSPAEEALKEAAATAAAELVKQAVEIAKHYDINESIDIIANAIPNDAWVFTNADVMITVISGVLCVELYSMYLKAMIAVSDHPNDIKLSRNADKIGDMGYQLCSASGKWHA